jgi:hypothetical protein
VAYYIYTGARGRRFVGEGGFGGIVALISRESDCTITRHVADQAAAKLLHEVGQHTQAEVIRLHEQGVPGFGPANPVNRSTHCRRNDGVAYRFWIPGFRIPRWARGIDCDVGRRDAFCATARRHGYTVTVTYPGSVGEAQHVNFRKRPRRPSLWVMHPVRAGDTGPRARWVIWALRKLGYITPHHNAHHRIDATVVKAIKLFQRDHHQQPDGVVGIHTMRALAAARRARDRRKK